MTRRQSAGLVLIAALALGCRDQPPPPQETAHADSGAASNHFPTLPDSLALMAPGGVSIWFSGARSSEDSLGAECVERGLVIVRDSTRTLVPLLMTGGTPVLVNDSTIRARLWLHCRPGNTYEVNLRTGAPTRVK